MTMRYNVLIACLIFCFCFIQPTPAHANFFLFNIINDVLGIGDREKKPPVENKQSKSPVVRFGMKNSQVTAIQQALIKAKYLAGNADGVYGNKTFEAVKAFQSDAGLEPDGMVGPRTSSALKNFKGTRPKTNPPVNKPSPRPKRGSNGIPDYLYALPVLVTAYTRYDEGCTDYTYQGTYLRRGLCAVDPSVIPLGTRIYVPGYGEALADDIGGAIQGNRVDLAMDTLDEAFTWGVQRLTVYVLPK